METGGHRLSGAVVGFSSGLVREAVIGGSEQAGTHNNHFWSIRRVSLWKPASKVICWGNNTGGSDLVCAQADTHNHFSNIRRESLSNLSCERNSQRGCYHGSGVCCVQRNTSTRGVACNTRRRRVSPSPSRRATRGQKIIHACKYARKPLDGERKRVLHFIFTCLA